MAVVIEWDEKLRPWGYQECWFEHNGERVMMQANDVIVASWKDGKAREAWGQAEAAKIIARREYEASDECKLARAKEEAASLQVAVDAKQIEVAALEAKVK